MLPLKIQSKVIKGKGRGKGLGIPTVNFEIPPTLTIIHGVYAGYLYVNHKKFPAAIHFGPVPVFNQSKPTFEVFVLEPFFEFPAYGEVEIVQFIRPVKSFPNPERMVEQIEKDVRKIKAVLLN